jgi:nucleoside-diphosphate-sugar epimerase
MKVVVTGSNGFLGSALVDRLASEGRDEVRCLVRAGSDLGRLHALCNRHPEAPLELVVASLGSAPDAARAVEGADVVYHVAAATSGMPADFFLNTVVASKNLAEGVRLACPSARIVLVSSFSVYGTAALRRGDRLDETAPLEPHPERRDVYSHAKLRQERLFWDYRDRHGLNLTVLRPGAIYGPGGAAFSGRMGMPLPGLFLRFAGGNLLPLSYVENCAEALIVAAGSERAVGEAYNVHDDDLLSCRQYFRAYTRRVRRMRWVPVPYPALLALSWLLEKYHLRTKGKIGARARLNPYRVATHWKRVAFDNSKLKGLGWRPRVSTEEGMSRTFEWLRQQEPRIAS